MFRQKTNNQSRYSKVVDKFGSRYYRTEKLKPKIDSIPTKEIRTTFNVRSFLD